MLQSIHDEKGTLREYETIFILTQDSTADHITQVNSKVRSAIESNSGKILKVENLGKRKLAYEIKKQLKGIYMYWQYLGSQGMVKEIERNLRMLEPVIRYCTVRLATNIEAATQQSTVDEETYIKASTTGPDEEELALRPSAARFVHEDDEFDPELEELALENHEEA